MAIMAAPQWQEAEEHQRVLQHLAEQQRSMLDYLVAAQALQSVPQFHTQKEAGRVKKTKVTPSICLKYQIDS